MNNNPSELHTLIHAILDGHATDQQVVCINTLLRTDATARDLYLQLADTHSCLAVDEQLWSDETAQSRSLAAAKADDSAPKMAHYLDDVQVQFLVKESFQ